MLRHRLTAAMTMTMRSPALGRPRVSVRSAPIRCFSITWPWKMHAAESAVANAVEASSSSGASAAASMLPGIPPPSLADAADLSAALIQTFPLATSELHSVGLGSWLTPAGWVQNLVEFMHAGMGLPWWGAILVYSLGLKMVLLPFFIRQMRLNATLGSFQGELRDVQARLSAYKAAGNMSGMATETSKMAAMYRKYGANPISALAYGLVPFPFYIASFFGIEGIVHSGLPSVMQGGPLWLANLAIPDPLYILPLCSSVGILANFRVMRYFNPNVSGFVKYIGYVLAVFTIPVTAHISTGTVLYFLTLSVTSIAQTAILNMPAVRVRLGMPPSPAPKPGSARSLASNFEEAKRVFNDIFKEKTTNFKKRQDAALLASGHAPPPTYKLTPLKPPPGKGPAQL